MTPKLSKAIEEVFDELDKMSDEEFRAALEAHVGTPLYLDLMYAMQDHENTEQPNS